MTAQIGDDGLDLFGDPRPELLTDVARSDPGRRATGSISKSVWAFARLNGCGSVGVGVVDP